MSVEEIVANLNERLQGLTGSKRSREMVRLARQCERESNTDRAKVFWQMFRVEAEKEAVEREREEGVLSLPKGDGG